MLKESSSHHKKNAFPESTNITKEEMICENGFCALPNQQEISKQHTNDMNLFDPI